MTSAISTAVPASGTAVTTTEGPAAAAAPAVAPRQRRPYTLGRLFSPVTGRIAGKIIAPYLVLILILALLATYVVTRLVGNSLQERFQNLLLDSGHKANEAMVKQESDYLQALRLMTNTEGAPEALAAKDVNRLQELLLPLQTNAHLDLVDVVAADGSMVLALRGDDLLKTLPGGDVTKVIDAQLGATPLVQKVLSGQSDAQGDKYTAVTKTAWGQTLYTAAPVRIEDSVVGAVLVGTTLERAVGRLAKDSQSSITLYDAKGRVVVSTLPLDDLALSAPQTQEGDEPAGVPGLDAGEEIAGAAMAPDPVVTKRPLPLRRPYTELVGALEIRAQAAMPMGVALPVNFIQAAQFASRSQLTGLFGGVVAGVLILGLWLANVITRPIATLVKATEVLSKGDLSVEVPVTTSDETGKLTVSFNNMVEGLREREKVKSMFSQYVTSQVADAVMRGEVKLGGARQDVSILMTDIRSFTTLSESMDPVHLVSMLNRYFDRMIDSIIEFDGTLDKFIGDGILVEYNAPLRQGRFALRSVLTVLRMREQLSEFNRDQEERGEPTIRIGMGVHTGAAVMGNIGSEGKKVEYTAMGDTVNVAARLESQTKEVQWDIVISADTYELVRDVVEVGELMALHVKGRVEPVFAHKLISLKAGLELGRGLLEMPEPEVRPIEERGLPANLVAEGYVDEHGSAAAAAAAPNGHAAEVEAAVAAAGAGTNGQAASAGVTPATA